MSHAAATCQRAHSTALHRIASHRIDLTSCSPHLTPKTDFIFLEVCCANREAACHLYTIASRETLIGVSSRYRPVKTEHHLCRPTLTGRPGLRDLPHAAFPRRASGQTAANARKGPLSQLAGSTLASIYGKSNSVVASKVA